jgi:hypothetical protein
LIIYASREEDIGLAQAMLISLLDIPYGDKGHLLSDKKSFDSAIIHTTSLDGTLAERDRRKGLGRWVIPSTRYDYQTVSNDRQSLSVQSITLNDAINRSQHIISCTNQEAVPENSSEYPSSTKKQNFDNDAASAIEKDRVTTAVLERTPQSKHYVPSLQSSTSKEKLISSLRVPVTSSSVRFPTTRKNVQTSAWVWTKPIKHETSAEFGQVLHSLSQHFEPSQIEKEIKFAQQSRRVFSHTVPGLAQSISHLSNQHSSSMNTIDVLQLNLRASPWASSNRGFNAFTDFPSLCMRWKIHPVLRKPVFDSLKLILAERNIDYLLPAQALDVRFLKRQVIYARNEILEADETFSKFLKSIEGSYEPSGVIYAPPKVSVNIPKWSITLKQKTLEQLMKEVKPARERVVEYITTSFEHRQEMTVGLGAHKLNYISIDGGRYGGIRGELRLSLQGEKEYFEDLATRKKGAVAQNPQSASQVSSKLTSTVDQIQPGNENRHQVSTGEPKQDQLLSADGSAERKHSEVNVGEAAVAISQSGPTITDKLDDFVNSAFNLAKLLHESSIVTLYDPPPITRNMVDTPLIRKYTKNSPKNNLLRIRKIPVEN